MLFVEIYSPEKLSGLLMNYRTLVYPILFMGAYLETLIPFSLVIYGEVFFFAGSILAGLGKLNIWVVAAVLYSGGILGDNCSYWFGRRYGMNLFRKLSGQRIIGRFFSDEMIEKGVSFFHKKGETTVLFARLCGPFSWFVPALAGAFQQRYSSFVLFNTLGVICGISEFLIIGYLFGNNMELITLWLGRIGMVVPIVFLSSFLLIMYLRWQHNRSKNRDKHA